LNLEFESSFSEITSLQSAHDDMSVKPCDKCNIIMVNYVDLWLVHILWWLREEEEEEEEEG
jgi:hypothetical protein